MNAGSSSESIQRPARFKDANWKTENNKTPHELATKRYKERKKFFKESPRHKRGKLRLCKIFRSAGFNTECERRFHCPLSSGEGKYRYQVDVFASRGPRRIIAEVDGYIGHKTAYALGQQKLRTRRIKETYGSDIEVFRFTFGRLSKWTNKEIAEEMRL